MDMLGKVRRMRMRDSISISAIAKRTGLARNTIKKWLKAPGSVVPKYLRAKDLRKISSFEPVLLQALKADQLRHKDSRRTGRALFVQITAQGYRGGYSGVTDFVRAWREQGGKAPKAFVPLFVTIQPEAGDGWHPMKARRKTSNRLCPCLCMVSR